MPAEPVNHDRGCDLMRGEMPAQKGDPQLLFPSGGAAAQRLGGLRLRGIRAIGRGVRKRKQSEQPTRIRQWFIGRGRCAWNLQKYISPICRAHPGTSLLDKRAGLSRPRAWIKSILKTNLCGSKSISGSREIWPFCGRTGQKRWRTR